MTVKKYKLDYNKSTEINDCMYYDTVTQECRTGCAKEVVLPGTTCKFIDHQKDCACYKKYGL